MSVTQKAVAILRGTDDGNKLTKLHLKLVEMAVNGHLNRAGESAFEDLYTEVSSGAYAAKHRWLHDWVYLTQDSQGYVYWKGKQVEHYSFSNEKDEARAAAALAARCKKLEVLGFEVNSRTALSPECYNAAPGTPWKHGLAHYYTFFKAVDGIIGVFYCKASNADKFEIVSAYKKDGRVKLAYYPGAYEAFQALQSQGFTSIPGPNTYLEGVALLQSTGLTPVEINSVIGYPSLS